MPQIDDLPRELIHRVLVICSSLDIVSASCAARCLHDVAEDAAEERLRTKQRMLQPSYTEPRSCSPESHSLFAVEHSSP